MSDEQVEMARVSMNWPAKLKEEVQDLVGKRGLTDFVLEAVDEKLEASRVKVTLPTLPAGQESKAAAAVPEPVYDPVLDPQGAARMDALRAYAAEHPVQPEHTPEVVAEGQQIAEEIGLIPAAEDTEPEVDDHTPMHMTGPREEVEDLSPSPAPIFGGPPAMEPVKAPNELFARIQREAAEMGHVIKPASQVLAPERKDEGEEQRVERTPTPVGDPIAVAPMIPEQPPVPRREPAVEAPVQADPEPALEEPQAQSAPIAASDVCPNCGSTLIDGECWECG